MNPVAATLILLGTSLSLVSGLGLLRLRTSYARVHAAGKATPISFLLIAAGCGVELGAGAAAQLAVAAVALVSTLPVATHLLFRAIYRTTAIGQPGLGADEDGDGELYATTDGETS